MYGWVRVYLSECARVCVHVFVSHPLVEVLLMQQNFERSCHSLYPNPSQVESNLPYAVSLGTE